MKVELIIVLALNNSYKLCVIVNMVNIFSLLQKHFPVEMLLPSAYPIMAK